MIFKNLLDRQKYRLAGAIVIVAVAAGMYLSQSHRASHSTDAPTGKVASATGREAPDSAQLKHTQVLNEVRTWTVLQDVSVELNSSERKPAVSKIQLRAQLDEQLLEAAPGKRVYQYKLTNVDFQSINAEGLPAMAHQDIDEVRRSLSSALIILRTDDQRRELRFSAPHNTSLETLNLMRSVILSGSVFLPPNKQLGEWISQEADATGVFTMANRLVSYVADTAQIEKEPRAVQMQPGTRTLNSQGDALAALPGSLTRITFDAKAGHVLKADQRWTLRFQAAGIYATTNIRTQLDFLNKRVADKPILNSADSGAAYKLEDFVSELELEAASEAGLKKKIAAQKAGGETWTSLRSRFQSSDFHKDGAARFQFLEQLSALLFLQPEICSEVAEEMAQLKRDDPDYASKLSLLAGAFSNQETPEAEAAIVALADKMRSDADALQQIIPAMAAHRRPGEKIRDALLQQYENGISDEVKSTSTLALGTFAQRAQRARPDLNQDAVSRLTRDFESAPTTARQVTLAGALGNAGAQETFMSVKTIMGSTREPALQRSAIFDLRFVKDPAVDTWLQNLSVDRNTDGDLVIQALRVMRMRAPARGNLDAALAIGSVVDARATVRVEALHTIAHHVLLNPQDVRAALESFERDGNPQIAQQARQLLAKLPRAEQ